MPLLVKTKTLWGLLVGSTSLFSIYEFMKAYRDQTGDLDQLYEKNVRLVAIGFHEFIDAKQRS